MTSDDYTPTLRDNLAKAVTPFVANGVVVIGAVTLLNIVDELVAAHDAGVRADQAAVDASIAECFPGPLHSQQDIFVAEDIAATIRAVALTPTTEETEQ